MFAFESLQSRLALSGGPVIDVPASQVCEESSPLILSWDSAISISDSDLTGDMDVILSVDSGTLTATLSTGCVVYGSGTDTVEMVGTLIGINSSLHNSLVYHADSTVTTATLSIAANDQGNNCTNVPLTDNQNLSISVVPAPVRVSMHSTETVVVGNSLPFTGYSTIVAYDPSLTGSLSVTLSTGAGSLSVSASGSASVSGNNSESLTISGSLEDVNGTLAGLQYLADNSLGNDTLLITTSDEGHNDTSAELTNAQSLYIYVVPYTPIVHAPSGPLTVPQNDILYFTGDNAISVSDPSLTGSISVMLYGFDAVTASGSATVSGTGYLHTVVGTLTDVNDTLANLTYSGGNGNLALDIWASDLAHNGTSTELVGFATFWVSG